MQVHATLSAGGKMPTLPDKDAPAGVSRPSVQTDFALGATAIRFPITSPTLDYKHTYILIRLRRTQ